MENDYHNWVSVLKLDKRLLRLSVAQAKVSAITLMQKAFG
jgi:hypothetical protein